MAIGSMKIQPGLFWKCSCLDPMPGDYAHATHEVIICACCGKWISPVTVLDSCRRRALLPTAPRTLGQFRRIIAI